MMYKKIKIKQRLKLPQQKEKKYGAKFDLSNTIIPLTFKSFADLHPIKWFEF